MLLTTCSAMQVGRYFEVGKRRTTFFTEIRAGCVTFLTVCLADCQIHPIQLSRLSACTYALRPRQSLHAALRVIDRQSAAFKVTGTLSTR